jgi:hypothetical protein
MKTYISRPWINILLLFGSTIDQNRKFSNRGSIVRQYLVTRMVLGDSTVNYLFNHISHSKFQVQNFHGLSIISYNSDIIIGPLDEVQNIKID